MCVLPGGPGGPRGPWLPTPGLPLSPFSPKGPGNTRTDSHSGVKSRLIFVLFPGSIYTVYDCNVEKVKNLSTDVVILFYHIYLTNMVTSYFSDLHLT